MKEMTPYPASLGSGSSHTGRLRFCCGRRIRPVTQAERVSFPQHWLGPSPPPPHPGDGAPLHPELSPLLLVMFLIT